MLDPRATILPAFPHLGTPHAYGGRVRAQSNLAIPVAEGCVFIVDGSGTVNTLPPHPPGVVVTLFFTGSPTFVNSSRLIIPGAINVTFAPSQTVQLVSVGEGKWYVLSPQPGAPLQVGSISRFAGPASAIAANSRLADGSNYLQSDLSRLYSVIGNTHNRSTNIFINGSPYKQLYEDTGIFNGAIGAWSTDTNLPAALSYTSAIVTKDRVYLLGGYISGAVSTVYTAPVNADGTLGSWTTGTSLPGVLYGSSAIITKDRVYLLGGFEGAASSIVYTAPVNADGTLGSWTTGTSLPGVLYASSAIVTKDRVYLLGGNAGAAVSTVYTAPINSDGTLGSWTTGTSIPGALSNSQAVVTKDRVYLVGGSTSSAVYTAPINPDGTLGTWTTGTSLPGVLANSSAIVTKDRVYLLGGYVAGAVTTVYTASINPDGTLGSWTTGTPIPGGFFWSSAIVTKDRVYLLAGYVAAASAIVYTASLTGLGSTDYLTGTTLRAYLPLTPGGSFAVPRMLHEYTYLGGRMYPVIGV